ncbi:MAG: hypothetical protein HYV09_15750 [Deltaproteobacteria bacterium]|nr:hypothetical protein [Deltaproteobacteria bacterium]
MTNLRLPLLGLCVVASACATLAGEGKGDVDLPNALTGPFRALKHGEICDGDVCTGVDELPPGTSNGTISYPGAPPSRSPSVLVRGTGRDGDLRVVLYAERGPDGRPSERIVRMEAPDARTFEDVQDVLSAGAPFEGGAIGDPCALEVGGAIWLYYATGAGGIARARSTDGLQGRAFEKDAGPIVLGGERNDLWETEPPRAPAVVRLDDGSFHLFYASGASIGEATSPDGVAFTRLDADPSTPVMDPVIGPSEPVDPATLPPGVRLPFDDRAVDDPWVDRGLSAAGRVQYRLHFTGRDRRGGSSIGFAGRFGDSGRFEKRDGFVFGGKLFGDPDGNSHANAPTVARFGDFALMFASIDYERSQKLGIGIAPQRRTLSIR